MLSGLTFGNFDALCREATLPACVLFPYSPPATNATLSYNDVLAGTYASARNEQCAIATFKSGSSQYRDMGDLAICVVSVLLMIALLYRTYTKQAAVGRKEMEILFTWFMLTCVLQLITTAGLMPTEAAA